MKKIVIASAAMGGAALVAFGASGTFAAFSDSDTVSNSAGAATLVLDASSTSTATARAEALDLQPGEKAQFAYWIGNGGTMAGILEATTAVTDAPDTCNSGSETSAPDDCAAGGPGDFSRAATLAAGYAAGVRNQAACVVGAHAPNLVSEVPLNLAGNRSIGDVPVPVGAGACFIVTVELPGRAGNAVQGDRAEMSVAFTLEQDTSTAARG